MSESSVVVDTTTDTKDQKIDSKESFFKKYSAGLVIILLVIVVACVSYYREGFVSSDGVVARKSPQKQVRSDTEVDRTWNLEQLEKSVALLNQK